jgi:repressor LexA
VSARTADTPLTWRQNSVLDALKAYIDAHGYSPSLRDLCNITGLSQGTVHTSLNALDRRGLVTWEPSHARTVRPTRNGG